MRPALRRIIRTAILAIALLLLAGPLFAQHDVPIADPHVAYRVDGHVLLADGRPAAGVLVERATSRTDLRQYSSAFWTRTDAADAFVFELSGLGDGVGREWTLVTRRAGCSDAHVTFPLRAGRMGGWDADIATGITLTLPACRLDPPPTNGS
jgi:hypothetical protein